MLGESGLGNSMGDLTEVGRIWQVRNGAVRMFCRWQA